MDQNDRLPTVLIVEDFEDSAPTVAGDARDFFPNVRHYVVYRMFWRELGFG